MVDVHDEILFELSGYMHIVLRNALCPAPLSLYIKVCHFLPYFSCAIVVCAIVVCAIVVCAFMQADRHACN